MGNKSKAQSSEIKRSIFEALSEVSEAFSSPARLKIIQGLAQGPKSVEVLAEEIGESIANTSQHLQRLARAGLVIRERQGVSRIYSVASQRVLRVWEEFQELGTELIRDLQEKEDFLTEKDLRAAESVDEVLGKVRGGQALLLDVRSEKEVQNTPVPGALALPVDQLADPESLKQLKLSKNKPIYVFCRGRYCTLASDAVRALLKMGYRAYRLRESAFKLKVIQGGEK